MSMTKTGVKIRGPYSDERTYNYDHCFWSGRGNASHSKQATQEDIYEALGRRYDAMNAASVISTIRLFQSTMR